MPEWQRRLTDLLTEITEAYPPAGPPKPQFLQPEEQIPKPKPLSIAELKALEDARAVVPVLLAKALYTAGFWKNATQRAEFGFELIDDGGRLGHKRGRYGHPHTAYIFNSDGEKLSEIARWSDRRFRAAVQENKQRKAATPPTVEGPDGIPQITLSRRPPRSTPPPDEVEDFHERLRDDGLIPPFLPPSGGPEPSQF